MLANKNTKSSFENNIIALKGLVEECKTRMQGLMETAGVLFLIINMNIWIYYL